MKRRKKNFPAQAIHSLRTPAPGTPASPVPRKRIWLFRFVSATLSPLLFFLLLEAALRLAGFGHPVSFLLSARINRQESLIQNDRFAWRFLGRQMARQPFPLA